MIKNMMIVVDPIRQMNKTTPREIAKIRAVLYSVLPTSLLQYNTLKVNMETGG
jgi:hypothetical protein